MQQDAAEQDVTRATGVRWKLALVIVVTGVMAALVLGHVHRVNGPWYWWWPWRRLTWALYPLMLLAAVPFVAAQVWFARGGNVKWALLGLCAAVFTLEMTALSLQPPTGLARLPLIVQNVVNTSYYTDAVILYEQENIPIWEWLYQYPDVVLLLHLHARYKPPGLLMYYLTWITIFGPGKLAATVGGMGIALMAAAAPAALYRMMKVFGADTRAAFCAAGYLALTPSLLLFFPQFDQAYVTIASGLLALFGLTVLRTGRYGRRWAIAFGAAMFVATFASYIFLILGLFFTVYWLIYVADRGVIAGRRAMTRLILAALTCLALYGLLYVLTGFDPVRTFINIEAAQTIALIPLMRPFPLHVFDDVLDFAMGSGWIAFVLVGYRVLAMGRSVLFGRTPQDRLVQVALLQIVTVASAALLPGETARLWMLMLPLLMIPVGLELSTWPTGVRMTVYACLWLIMVVICQNMTFLYMGPELDGPR